MSGQWLPILRFAFGACSLHPIYVDRTRGSHRTNESARARHPRIVFRASCGRYLQDEARCFGWEEEFRQYSETYTFGDTAGTSSACYAKNSAQIHSPRDSAII